MKTVTLPVKGLNFAGCASEIEKQLGKVYGITQVGASYISQTVTVTYDDTIVRETDLHTLITSCGFLCGEPLQARDHSASATPAHGEMAAMGHGEHDMSNPAMAKAMEADMRRRFFISLFFTIPIVLYSPLGMKLFQLHLPTPFAISPNWILLILSTPVVWWGGWIFHVGTWRALHNRTLNMNVLVSLGVLVAYFFSVFATLFAPQIETSYDAAAMLVRDKAE